MQKSGFQVLIEKCFSSFMSLLKVMILSKFKVNLPEKNTEECVILGNGPSLKGFLNDHIDFLNGKSIIAVNYFSRTSEFTQVKPDYYVLASPEYFVKEEKEGWMEIRKKTLDMMSNDTSWTMHLAVPSLAKKHNHWKESFSNNQHIKIVYYNNTPIEGLEWVNHLFFKKNLGMPRPHNVLVPSIFLAINMGFKSIHIVGADHSWTKELFVTDENEVLLSQKHFYDQQLKAEDSIKNTPLPRPMYKGGSTEKRKLHEVLMKFVYSFRSYWDLKRYADSEKAQIYNLTKGSFIDAFEKTDLKGTLKKENDEK